MTTMSALDGQSRQRDLQEVFLRSTKITALLAFCVGSILMLDGKALISVWVGPNYVFVYVPLMVLVLGHAISVAQSPSVNILLARGQHRPMGWWTLGEGVLNLALSVYWAGKYGIVGVALGTAVPQIFVKLTLQPWFALRAAELSAREYILGALVRPLAVCGIFLVLGRLGVSWLPGMGLLELGFKRSMANLALRDPRVLRRIHKLRSRIPLGTWQAICFKFPLGQSVLAYRIGRPCRLVILGLA